MSHPLLLALFATPEAAAGGARAVQALGIDSQSLSIVARSHDEEGVLSRELGGTPGVDLEDSRVAARLGEIGGRILAAIAVVMPGIGPIVAGGPLAAELGEVAGHAAGGVAGILGQAGIAPDRAGELETRIEQGDILLGVHVRDLDVSAVRAALEASGASTVDEAHWT